MQPSGSLRRYDKARSPPGRRGIAARAPIFTHPNAKSRVSQAKLTFDWSVEHASSRDQHDLSQGFARARALATPFRPSPMDFANAERASA